MSKENKTEDRKEEASQILHKVIDEMSHPDSFSMMYLPRHGHSMPSRDVLGKLVEKLREVIFPGYFGNSQLNSDTLSYFIGVNVDIIYRMLNAQIQRGICFECRAKNRQQCDKCENQAPEITQEIIKKLPELRRKLSTDVQAAYNGDPAAKSYGEVIFSYPTIRAVSNYRIAHELYNLDVPLIPRIITEMAHSETGIDIHPAAQIGEYFAIDHGTGVVIGETCEIGQNVKIYQGVTLGAKSFPADENGHPIKGIKRHPVVEGNVIIYSNASILGRVRVGKNSMIGGNIWVTNDVAPDSKIVQRRPRPGVFSDGAGI